MVPPPRKKAKRRLQSDSASQGTLISKQVSPDNHKHQPVSVSERALDAEDQTTADNSGKRQHTDSYVKPLDLWEHTLPLDLRHLAQKCAFSQKYVRSATKIEHQVQLLLRQLQEFDEATYKSEPGVVALLADGQDANKMVSIVNIAKRNLSKDTTLHQYARITARTVTKKKPRPQDVAIDGDVHSDSSTPAFETGRWAPQKPPTTPVMVLYLSLVPIPELRERFGGQIHKTHPAKEQTKAPP